MARHKDPRYFFYKKTFYLDLKHFRGEVDLIKDIKRFGGKVESFLSKDVNYVISDRPEAKPKIDAGYPETPGSFAPLMSPTELYKSPYGFMPSPAPSSPFNERSKGTVTSRGLALVQKAKQKSGGSGDVLGICNQWKIKVFHVQVITFFVNKLKNLYGKKVQEHRETRVLAELPQSLPHKLTVPFVKVEDVKMQYRTHYKELRPVDQIFKSDLSLAFRKVHADFNCGDLNSKNLNSSVLKEVNFPHRDVHSPITVNFTPVIQKNFSTPSVFKKQFGSKMGLLNDSKENHIKENLRNKSKENIMVVPSLKQKKDKGSSNSTRREKKYGKQKYCEICQEHYADLEDHISSNKHLNYVNDTIYFGDLREVISTMPGLDSFLKKVAKQRQERVLQQPELKSHESHVEYPFEEYGNYQPHSGKVPLLNCEENFSDCTQSIQPEPERTGNGNNVPATKDSGVAHPSGFHCPDPDQENPSVSLADCRVKPKSLAQCDDLSNDVYDAVTEEYISASCSTDDSNMLAYLEDSADNLVFCKESPCAQNGSPAILLKESPIIETRKPFPLIAFHSPYTNASEDALDLTSKTKDLSHDNVTLCSFQMKTAEGNEIISQYGDNSSSAALDLSLPPPVLSPVYSYMSSAKRKPYSFSVNKAKRLKFDADASLVEGNSHFSKDETSQSYKENCSVPSHAPDLLLPLGNDVDAVNVEFQNADEDRLDCAPLLSPIGSVQSCFELRMLSGDEEATQVKHHHCGDELEVCPGQNVNTEMKDCSNNLKSEILIKSQECVKSLLFPGCTTVPPVQGHQHQIEELETVSRSFAENKSPAKDVSIVVESCNTVGPCETVCNCASNTGPVIEVVEENSQQNSHLMHSTFVEYTSVPIHGFDNEPNDADLPIFQCCVPHKNDNLESITTADAPVLELKVGASCTSAALAQELNVVCNASSVIQSSNLEANLQLQEAAAKQNSPCSSPDKAMTLESPRELNPPDITLNDCIDNSVPICLKNVDEDAYEHQNEPAFLSFKNTQTNSASVSFCPKLLDSQTDGNGCVSNHCAKTAFLGCEEGGKQSQLSATFLPHCSSESFDSQKDVNDIKYYDCSKAIPFDWETDLQVSGLPSQNSMLHNSALNFSVNHSSGGVESAIASGSADASSKWVSECDISSDSETDWGNLKSNVDSLCQELEKLNSEPEVVTEIPLSLALI